MQSHEVASEDADEAVAVFATIYQSTVHFPGWKKKRSRLGFSDRSCASY